MLEIIALPNCTDPDVFALMPFIWPVAIILIASVWLLGRESEKNRIHGEIGICLSLFLGVLPMFKFMNVLFFCNATGQVDTSYFWFMNILANIILVILACGILFGVWRLRHLAVEAPTLLFMKPGGTETNATFSFSKIDKDGKNHEILIGQTRYGMGQEPITIIERINEDGSNNEFHAEHKK